MIEENLLNIEKITKEIFDSLINLEKKIFNKIDKLNLDNKIDNLANSINPRLEAQIMEYGLIIKNLNEEMNNLQIQLIDCEKEVEFEKQKNSITFKRLNKFKEKSLEFMESIENDINLIQQKNNGNL